MATTAGGYYMGAIGPVDLTGLLLTCAGTGLVAGGAAALNQVAERDTDALMERTRMRPVADKRLSAAEGRIVGAVLALSGLALLWFTVNTLATMVARATLVSYVLFYTPLKARSCSRWFSSRSGVTAPTGGGRPA